MPLCQNWGMTSGEPWFARSLGGITPKVLIAIPCRQGAGPGPTDRNLAAILFLSSRGYCHPRTASCPVRACVKSCGGHRPPALARAPYRSPGQGFPSWRIRHHRDASEVLIWPEHENLKADLLGEHNEQILSEILGCSQEEITALYREGAIVRDPCLEREIQTANPGFGESRVFESAA